jgi:hypothetical protein
MNTMFFESIIVKFRNAVGGYANLCACDRERYL